MRPGPRRTVYALVLLAGGVVAGSLIVFRDDLLEMWLLHRWPSAGPEERTEILSGLGRVGSARSIPWLLRLLEEEAGDGKLARFSREPLESRAGAVLGGIYPRLRSRWKAETALRLRDLAASGCIEAADALRRLDPFPLEVLPRLAEDLNDPEKRIRSLAGGILMDAWPRSRAAIFTYAETASPEALFDFLLHGDRILGDFGPGFREGFELWAFRVSDRRLEVASAMLEDHPDHRARCIALAVAVTPGPSAESSPLVRAYEENSSPMVRKAAIRIAAFLREAPGSLDLPAIIEREADPVLRAEAILARDVWMYRLEAGSEIALWDGGAFSCPPARVDTNRTRVVKPWSEKERESLEEILRTERNPLVRDAASMALAGRHRSSSVVRRPDLRVHEWAVWHDTDRAPNEIRERRGASVLFFHSESPLVALVQVTPPWRRWAASGLLRPGEEVWALPGALPPTGGIRGILYSRRPVAPWLTPSQTGSGNRRGVSEGREWCGLRIGYGAALECESKPAAGNSSVEALRRAGASLLAIGGRQESFLSSDGSFEAPYPVEASWEDPGRGELTLRYRGQETYPEEPSDEAESGNAREQVLPTASAILVIRKEREGLQGKLLEGLPLTEAAGTVKMSDLDLAGDQVAQAFQDALVKEGLSAAEADSLVSTWREKLFEADGVRVVTIIAPWVHDAVRPLRIVPQPGELVRAGVVWKEMPSGD